jgi:hypothetical protein
MSRTSRWCWTILAAAALLSSGGCALAGLASAMGQNFEYQKLIEVPPQYTGLEYQTVAVIVETDLAILYEHQNLVPALINGISARIQQNVEGARVLSPQMVLAWQYHTPQWNALPYGDIALALGVERIVYLDVYEYRLHPIGNSWIWEGLCAANVGVIEADSFDPDLFVEEFVVQAEFPHERGIGRESANATQVETGLLYEFLKKAGGLFYLHTVPKHPDKYDPAMDRT